MGRIEDSEAERMERARQDRKVQEQQLKTKQIAEHQQFQNFVKTAQNLKGQNNKQDQQKSELTQDAKRSLMARRGIEANNSSERLWSSGNQSNVRSREKVLSKEQERAGARENLARGQAEGQRSNKSTEKGISRGGAKQQEQPSQQKEMQRPKDAGKDAPLPATTFAAIGQAAIQALDGMGAKASGKSSAAEQADKVQRMIAEIVQSVRQGVDKNGFGLMQITLHDDIMNGATLTVLSSQSGIHLKIDTNETGQRRSDRPIENLLTSSANELNRAMEQAKVKLVGLEINGEKVIA